MFGSNVLSALHSLWEQRQRSVLSAIGVLVANVAILLLVSIALGVKKDVAGQVEDLGVNTLIVLPGKFDPNSFNPNLGGQSYLQESFCDDLRAVPGVVRVAPVTFAGGGVRFKDREAFPFVIATTSDWFRIRPLQMRSGTFFTDPKEGSAMVVLGSLAADALFGEGVDPVGQEVLINKAPYRIVGVTQDAKAEQSLFSFGSFQNVVYVPYHAFRSKSTNQQIDRIMVQGATDAEPRRLVRSLEQALSKRLDDQQFSVLTQQDLLKLVFTLMNILTWLLVGLTSIALFVGGVGIMTVMLMSVSERTREIGIRKTVGARTADVFAQFLTESVLLSILGCVAGVALSFGVCVLLHAFTPIKPLVTPGVVLLCLTVSVAMGGAFGLIPAMHAARKQPVEALRHE